MASGSSIAGTWAYQSYQNVAEQPVFGAGTFTFTTPTATTLKGTLDMGDGMVLDLKGTIQRADKTSPLTAKIVGTGRDKTPTAGWQYDYHGYLAYHWPKGVKQVAALVGTVLRAKPHNGSGAPAGVTASFIAVKLS